jgi:putative SOS response-associated peptidase YedK
VLKANPEWRRLLNARRCIVPAEQFFEWKRVAEVKTREYCIRLRSGKPMMIAGLWNRSDSCGETFAYISCAANPLVSLIHDQMPALLDPTEVANWFNPDATLESLLSSPPAYHTPLVMPLPLSACERCPDHHLLPNHRRRDRGA